MIKHKSLLLAAIFLAAFCFRFILLMKYGKEDFIFGINMALKHAAVARNLVQFGAFSISPEYLAKLTAKSKEGDRQVLIDPDDVGDPNQENPQPYMGRMPGYPLFLAAIWKITGSKRFIHAQFLTLAMDSVAAAILTLMALELWGMAAGLCAGCLYALWPPLALLSITPGHDAPQASLIIFAFYFFLRGTRSRPIAAFSAAGLILGVASLLRQDALLVAVFMAVPIFFLAGPRRSLQALALGSGLCLLVVVPWALRNKVVFGRVSLTPPVLGANLLIGLGEHPNPWNLPANDEELKKFVQKRGSSALYFSEEFDRIATQEALRIIKSHPFFYLKTMVKRFARSLAPTFMPVYPGPYEYERDFGGGGLAYLREFPWAAAAHFGLKFLALLLWPLSVLAFFLYPEMRKILFCAAMITCYYWATHIPMHLEYRYLLPGFWPLFLLSAGSLCRIKSLH